VASCNEITKIIFRS